MCVEGMGERGRRRRDSQAQPGRSDRGWICANQLSIGRDPDVVYKKIKREGGPPGQQDAVSNSIFKRRRRRRSGGVGGEREKGRRHGGSQTNQFTAWPGSSRENTDAGSGVCRAC